MLLPLIDLCAEAVAKAKSCAELEQLHTKLDENMLKKVGHILSSIILEDVFLSFVKLLVLEVSAVDYSLCKNKRRAIFFQINIFCKAMNKLVYIMLWYLPLCFRWLFLLSHKRRNMLRFSTLDLRPMAGNMGCLLLTRTV